MKVALVRATCQDGWIRGYLELKRWKRPPESIVHGEADNGMSYRLSSFGIPSTGNGGRFVTCPIRREIEAAVDADEFLKLVIKHGDPTLKFELVKRRQANPKSFFDKP